LIDHTDPLEAGSCRQGWQHPVPAAHDQQVRWIDRAHDHPHPDFARPRMRLRDVADVEHVAGYAKTLEDGSSHCLSVDRWPLCGGISVQTVWSKYAGINTASPYYYRPT